MVRVYFELDENNIVPTSIYFNNSYQDSWFNDWAKRVIKEIDKSELVSANLVNSDVLGPVTVREISAGSKALIMMHSDKSIIVNANSCGDNCAGLLAELSKQQDFSIYLAYPMNFGNAQFDMVIDRSGTICHTSKEFEREYLTWRHSITS